MLDARSSKLDAFQEKSRVGEEKKVREGGEESTISIGNIFATSTFSLLPLNFISQNASCFELRALSIRVCVLALNVRKIRTQPNILNGNAKRKNRFYSKKIKSDFDLDIFDKYEENPTITHQHFLPLVFYFVALRPLCLMLIIKSIIII